MTSTREEVLEQQVIRMRAGCGSALKWVEWALEKIEPDDRNANHPFWLHLLSIKSELEHNMKEPHPEGRESVIVYSVVAYDEHKDRFKGFRSYTDKSDANQRLGELCAIYKRRNFCLPSHLLNPPDPKQWLAQIPYESEK